MRALRKHGPDVGMDDIAAEAGVTKPVLYRHFTDKSDLYLAVGKRGSQELAARLRPALAGEGTAQQRIHRAVDAYLAAIEEQPELYSFAAHQHTVGRSGTNELVIVTTLAALFREHLETFGTDPDAAEVCGHAIVGMMSSAGDWWLARRPMPRQRLVHLLSSLIWRAVDGPLQPGGVAADPACQPPTAKPTRRESGAPIST